MDVRERPFTPTNVQSLTLFIHSLSARNLTPVLLEKHVLFLKLSKNFNFSDSNFAEVAALRDTKHSEVP